MSLICEAGPGGRLREGHPVTGQGEGALQTEDPSEGLGPVAEGVQGKPMELPRAEPHRFGGSRDGPAGYERRHDRPQEWIRGRGTGRETQRQLFKCGSRIGRRVNVLREAAHFSTCPDVGELHTPIPQLMRGHAEQGGGGTGMEPHAGPRPSRTGTRPVRTGIGPGDKKPALGPQQIHAPIGQHGHGFAVLRAPRPHDGVRQPGGAFGVREGHAKKATRRAPPLIGSYGP